MEIISFAAGYTKRVSQLYKHLHTAGCKNLLLAIGAFADDDVRYGDNELQYSMESYINKSKADGIVHTIAIPAFFDDKTLAKMSFARVKELYFDSFKIAKMAGCKGILVSPILFDEIDQRVRLTVKQKKSKGLDMSEDEAKRLKMLQTPRQLEENEVESFYLSIADYATANDLFVLITNQCGYYNGKLNRSFMSDAYRLKEFVAKLNAKTQTGLFKVNLDIGVCNLLGQNFYQVITVLKDDIGMISLRENDGYKGSALMPFSCALGGLPRMDWLAIIKALRAIDYTGLMYMDYIDTYNAAPVSLRKYIVQYAKHMADYLNWQIEMEHTIAKYDKRVLFGAGNMCRNYMKCYGADYPPLFTCDNNSKIWGQTFEGLEIKNPEEIKLLPEDVAIFICNTYYDEIEAQLKSYGLNNPIERYNDEFLPSMYGNRFDADKREISDSIII